MTRIVVTSVVKAGATWFRFLIYGAEKGIPINSLDVAKFYPFDRKENYIWSDTDKRLFVKSHANYSEDIPIIKDNDGVILIYRNPFDIMFSWLSHQRISGDLIYKPHNVESNLKFWILNNYYIDHYNSWKNRVKLMIKYEDMVKDVRGTLNKVNDTMNFNWSSENIDNAIKAGNKEYMQNIEEHEIKNKIDGMFYELRKADPFINRGERFVGGRRRKEDLEVFLKHHQDNFLQKYSTIAEELGYDLHSIIDKWKKTYSLP
tara:strand:- start:1128 stop:1907 length:780 start_codon:yes stop_codon:yes gene_type:complete